MSLSFHNHLKRYKDDIEKNLGQKLKIKLSLFFQPWSFYVLQVVNKSDLVSCIKYDCDLE